MSIYNEIILVDDNGVTYSNNVVPEEQWLTQDVPFTLWFEPSRLSVNLKYVLPIRVLVDTKKSENGKPLPFTVKMNLDASEVFSFVPRQVVVGSVQESLNDVFNITWGEHWYLYQVQNGTSISNETIVVNDKLDSDVSFFISEMTTIYNPKDRNIGPWACRIDSTHVLFTFYVMCCNSFEETVIKNIRVNIFNEQGTEISDTVIRIGATFYDESEELRINARNQGIVLPYDICKAFWECGFHEYHIDRTVERDKLKELLFNYMGIRGECGNYRSAIKSLEWFGWGDKLELSQLLVLNQNVSKYYLNDFFDVFSDIPSDFSNFRRTTFLSIKAHLNKPYHLGRPVPGPIEGTPVTEEGIEASTETLYKNPAEDGLRWLINKDIFDNNPKFTGTKPNTGDIWQIRYDYIMHEFALKLACLASLYETYLLPVQLNVISSTVVEHVSTPSLKLLSGSYRHNTQLVDNITLENEPYVTWGQTSYTVQLDQTNKLDSYIDLEFYINTPKDYNQYISLAFYLSDSKELKYYKFDGVRCTEYITRYTAKVSLEEIVEPTTINNLAVVIEGHWFETNINIHYPDYTLECGTLHYDYSLTDIESRIVIGTSEDYDPNLMLSCKYDNFKLEEIESRKVTETSEEKNKLDVYFEESFNLVSELQSLNINVAQARKNLIFTKSLENVYYIWAGPNELELDNASEYKPYMFHGITYDSVSEEHLNLISEPYTFTVNDKTRELNYCLTSEEPANICLNIPKNIAYIKIYNTGNLTCTCKLEDDNQEITYFTNNLPITGVSLINVENANTVDLKLLKNTKLYGIEFISLEIANQVTDLCEIHTNINETNINGTVYIPYTHLDRTVKIIFSGDFDVENIQIEYGINHCLVDSYKIFNEIVGVYNYTIHNDGLPFFINIPQNINYIKITSGNDLSANVTVCLQNTLNIEARKLESSEYELILNNKEVSDYFDAYIVENVYYFLGEKLVAMLDFLTSEQNPSEEQIEHFKEYSSCLFKYTDGITLPGTSKKYNLIDMKNDMANYSEDLTKIWISLIVHELNALERSGNYYYSGTGLASKRSQKSQFYLQIISKEPMYKLFESPEKFNYLGISSLEENFLKNWLRENLTWQFNYYNNDLFKFKSSKITPQLQFLLTRHKFVPQQENDTRFVSNSFFKDDLVCVRIANKYTNAPFIYHLKDTEKEYRFEFIPSFFGSKTSPNFRSCGFTNYVIMERTDPDSAYLQPGFYNVIFKFNYNSKDNENKTYKNFIKIKPLINSKLYNDIYSTNI